MRIPRSALPALVLIGGVALRAGAGHDASDVAAYVAGATAPVSAADADDADPGDAQDDAGEDEGDEDELSAVDADAGWEWEYTEDAGDADAAAADDVQPTELETAEDDAGPGAA